MKSQMHGEELKAQMIMIEGQVKYKGKDNNFHANQECFFSGNLVCKTQIWFSTKKPRHLQITLQIIL